MGRRVFIGGGRTVNWKNIKTVLIVVLAAVDIFFMLAIASAYRSNYFISENTIADAVQILADDDITVDAEAIPKKIPSPSAYMCAIGNDYEEQVASLDGQVGCSAPVFRPRTASS